MGTLPKYFHSNCLKLDGLVRVLIVVIVLYIKLLLYIWEHHCIAGYAFDVGVDLFTVLST